MEKLDLSPSRRADQYVLRLPDGMRDQIAAAARANQRSMNAELVARLQASFNATASPEIAILLARKEHEITAMELKHQLLLDRTRNFASRTKDVVGEAVDSLGDLEDEVRGFLEGTIVALDDLHYDAQQELAQLEAGAARRRVADLVSTAEEAARRYDEAVAKSAEGRRGLPSGQATGARPASEVPPTSGQAQQPRGGTSRPEPRTPDLDKRGSQGK